jgi:putative FmdB family regulatory protein
MPTYVYRCTKGHTFELFHSIADDSRKRCPRCRAAAKRVPSGGAGVLFKGSGFYITDYRSKSYHESAKRESGAGESKSEGTKTESAKPSEGAKSESGAKKKDTSSRRGRGGKKDG